MSDTIPLAPGHSLSQTGTQEESNVGKVEEGRADNQGSGVQDTGGRVGEVPGVQSEPDAERADTAGVEAVHPQRAISHTFHGLTNAQHGVHLVIADPREYACKDCKDLAARVKAKFKEIGYDF